jgi:hypothetical protein
MQSDNEKWIYKHKTIIIQKMVNFIPVFKLWRQYNYHIKEI